MDLAAPRIFLPQEPPPHLDIARSEVFGTLQPPMLKADFQVVSTGHLAVVAMSFHLQTFNDEDYILPVGDPVLIGLAQLLAAHYNEGRFKVLKWDRRQGCYYGVSVDLHGSIPKPHG